MINGELSDFDKSVSKGVYSRETLFNHVLELGHSVANEFRVGPEP
jgi:hypothetical protein